MSSVSAWNTPLSSISLQDKSLVLDCYFFFVREPVKSWISSCCIKLILGNYFPLRYRNQPLHKSSISPCFFCLEVTLHCNHPHQAAWMALPPKLFFQARARPSQLSHLLCSLKKKKVKRYRRWQWREKSQDKYLEAWQKLWQGSALKHLV